MDIFYFQGRTIRSTSPSDRSSELTSPTGVTLDAKNNLYVADPHNNRIQKLIRQTHIEPADFATRPHIPCAKPVGQLPGDRPISEFARP